MLLRITFALMLSGLLVGCRENQRSPRRTSAVVPLQVEPLNEQQVKPMIGANRGKVFVLNFWATWCKPCIEELPDYLRLARELGARGLNVTMVSTDEQTDEAKMFALLRRQSPSPATHYVARADDFEAFVNAVHRDWIGGVPATFVFDRRGKLRYHHLGKHSYDKLRQIVTPLL